jgi:hypothetical protein
MAIPLKSVFFDASGIYAVLDTHFSEQGFETIP